MVTLPGTMAVYGLTLREDYTMRSPRLLLRTASVLAVAGLLPIQAMAAPAGRSGRIIVAEDDMMGMQPTGGMGQGGTQTNQGATNPGKGGMGGGTKGCCGMGGMQQGAAPSGGMGMMDDNMRRMQQNQAMPGMATNGVDMTDRIDGRIAFLRAELKITDAQATTWNQFAEALRSSRQHLLEARQQLAAPASSNAPTARLDQYERHLTARLEAIRTARTAFTQLYAVLDEHQKHVADELLVPFLATF
ncbi:Spy/CpxP family protein refolding chaperone [Methylorubrum thiocyanatum]|uniref:Spy/CpxP family protein refolding chaperone n=1 Tax=Methylorubrum thiocyanatum TaxID=47958 RepID=UPI0035C7B9E3